MQLKFSLLIIVCLLCKFLSVAQKPDSWAQPSEIDFFYNYYEQDGDHSAVTGGIGTQKLIDRAFRILARVPFDSTSTIILDAGLNTYSSASTDRIDSRISSASAQDTRIYLRGTYSKARKNQAGDWNLGFSGSIESDYISTGVHGGWSHKFKNHPGNIEINGLIYFDRWIPYFPEELRKGVATRISTDKRNTYLLNASYGIYLSRQTYFSLFMGIGYQDGLLSTPFHRVYFENFNIPRIEKLPGSKFYMPVGVQFNAYLAKKILSKINYRYYWDDFNINSNTLEIEVPIQILDQFSISPTYRYYTQSAANFFYTYREAYRDDPYYSSDYDYSAFHSHKYGIGMRYTPLWLVGKNAELLIRMIDLRILYYERSDGLKAWMVGVVVGFGL